MAVQQPETDYTRLRPGDELTAGGYTIKRSGNDLMPSSDPFVKMQIEKDLADGTLVRHSQDWDALVDAGIITGLKLDTPERETLQEEQYRLNYPNTDAGKKLQEQIWSGAVSFEDEHQKRGLTDRPPEDWTSGDPIPGTGTGTDTGAGGEYWDPESQQWTAKPVSTYDRGGDSTFTPPGEDVDFGVAPAGETQDEKVQRFWKNIIQHGINEGTTPWTFDLQGKGFKPPAGKGALAAPVVDASEFSTDAPSAIDHTAANPFASVGGKTLALQNALRVSQLNKSDYERQYGDAPKDFARLEGIGEETFFGLLKQIHQSKIDTGEVEWTDQLAEQGYRPPEVTDMPAYGSPTPGPGPAPMGAQALPGAPPPPGPMGIQSMPPPGMPPPGMPPPGMAPPPMPGAPPPPPMGAPVPQGMPLPQGMQPQIDPAMAAQIQALRGG